MRNMAVTTFMALGLLAAAALAQQQPGRTGPSSPSSSQPANPNSTGSRSGPRTRPSDSQSSTRNSTASPVTFDEVDKNQDGKLTKKEAKKGARPELLVGRYR
ncbi:MAG TPA: hypothetical protein VFX89_03865 [Gammaproteobacteria bacterium]|nr:hypothetical protein [Gammaproteobacteria bacterium]